jgi:hypothetical protein
VTILATAPVSGDANLSTADTLHLVRVDGSDRGSDVPNTLDSYIQRAINDPTLFPYARKIAEDIGRKFAAKFVDDIDLVVGIIHATRVAASMDDMAAEAFAVGMRQALEQRMQSGRRPLWPGQAKTFVEMLDYLSETAIYRCMDQRDGSAYPDPADYLVLEDVEAAMCPPPNGPRPTKDEAVAMAAAEPLEGEALAVYLRTLRAGTATPRFGEGEAA